MDEVPDARKTDGSEIWNTLEGTEHGKKGQEVQNGMREGKGCGTYSVGVKDLSSRHTEV